MPPLARKPKQIYINREIDTIINNYIENETPKLLFVHGQGGVGKTTLLKKFLSYDAEEIPTVLINLKDRELNSFVDILLDEDITSVKHCPSFEKIRTILLKEPKLLNAIINSDTDVVESKIEEYDKEWGEYAKIVIDTLKFGAKFLKSSEEKKKKEFLNNPEFVLLSALAEDFEDYGLFMVDTFEKIKNNDIESKINFTDSGELSMRLTEKHYRLKDYIEGLVYLLVGSSTFIVAGRNTQDELNMDVPLDYTDELSLENFSFSNIKELFSLYVKRDKKLSMPSDKHIKQIEELTNGNPLIVGLFPKVAREYDSWDELDYKEMERRIKTDEEFGLLFYMTDRVLSHLEESKEVWKLVIPRVLNREIEKLLFKDEKILKELIEVGLATKGTGKESERYYLHDDVHRAIVAYYEREFKNGFSSWHDAKVVADLHRELMGFYAKYTELYGVNSAFEGCYHKMMLREGFENDFEVSREEFAYLALGSISLNYQTKFRVCSSFETFSNFQISELIKIWKEEKDKWTTWMSQELYSRLIKALNEGKSDQIIEDIPFLESLKDELKDDWSYYYLIASAYENKKEYNKVIEVCNKAINEIKSKKDKAYNNIGNAYRKKEEYDKAIEAYKKAVEINPKNDEAYHNMGITYIEKGEYDNAIEAYQEALEINPKNNAAYHGIGLAYHKKEEYDKAIEAYKKAVEINPSDDKVYYNIGNIYLEKKEYDNAIKAYQKVIKINPKSYEAYKNIGKVYFEKGEYGNAVYSYKKLIKINPNDDGSYVEISRIYIDFMTKIEDGITYAKKAIEINPNNEIAYHNIGVGLTSLKKYKEAIFYYKKAIDTNPNYYNSYHNLYHVCFILEKFDVVITISQKEIEINPDKHKAYYFLGSAYINLKKYEEGIEFIKKCIDLNYKTYHVYYALAMAYHGLKNYNKAIVNLIEAIRLNPNQYDNYPNLFELQLTQNQSFDQELEQKYIELFQNKKESFIQYEMLKILQDISHRKEVSLEQWKQKYEGVELGWSFDELETWSDEIEDNDVKARVQEALEVFKGHG